MSSAVVWKWHELKEMCDLAHWYCWGSWVRLWFNMIKEIFPMPQPRSSQWSREQSLVSGESWTQRWKLNAKKLLYCRDLHIHLTNWELWETGWTLVSPTETADQKGYRILNRDEPCVQDFGIGTNLIPTVILSTDWHKIKQYHISVSEHILMSVRRVCSGGMSGWSQPNHSQMYWFRPKKYTNDSGPARPQASSFFGWVRIKGTMCSFQCWAVAPLLV